jgi:hypothetical protein
MSQKRIQDFGSPVVAKSLKTLSASYLTSAILNGCEFVVDGPDRFRVLPGSAVTHQGVIILEDEPKFLTVTNSSNPAEYTVYYQHVDQDISGGVPAELTIVGGLLTPEVVEGVIIGYVIYPGGGIPLANNHFVRPTPMRIGKVTPTRENSDWLVPVKGTGYMITSTTGGAIDITDTWDITGAKPEMYLKLRNNGVATGGVTLMFPFKVKELPYAKFQIVNGTDINATLSPSFIDTEGNITSLLVTPYTGSPTLRLYTEDLPRASIQHANTLVYIQLQFSLSPGRQIKLQSLGLTEYNLPI